MDNAQLINQDSGDYEYYSPVNIIESSRHVMGSIDLDPASSFKANETVKSKSYYSLESFFHEETGNLIGISGGLEKEWHGNVWMNHPFSRGESPCKPVCKKEICKKRGYHADIHIPGNAEWIKKICTEYGSGNIGQACCITYASTSEGWFAPLHEFYQCFPFKRTNYYLPDGTKKTGVTKGSVITYLGEDPTNFIREFKLIGHVRPGDV